MALVSVLVLALGCRCWAIASLQSARTGCPNATGNASSALLSSNRTDTLLKEKEVLQGLMGRFKEDIKHLNQVDSRGDARQKEVVAEITKQLQEDERKLHNPSLSELSRQALLNHTAMEKRQLADWSTAGSLGKKMYHAELSVTHGMMAKVKKVMQAYDSVLSTGTMAPSLASALKLQKRDNSEIQ